MRRYQGPRKTQAARHKAADGHVHNSPTAHDPHAPGAEPGRLKHDPSADNYPTHFGPRIGRTAVTQSNLRLTNITNERTRVNPHPLAKRFTKFIGNFRGQVRIPHNLLASDRFPAGDQNEAERRIDVGPEPMPED